MQSFLSADFSYGHFCAKTATIWVRLQGNIPSSSGYHAPLASLGGDDLLKKPEDGPKNSSFDLTWSEKDFFGSDFFGSSSVSPKHSIVQHAHHMVPMQSCERHS